MVACFHAVDTARVPRDDSDCIALDEQGLAQTSNLPSGLGGCDLFAVSNDEQGRQCLTPADRLSVAAPWQRLGGGERRVKTVAVGGRASSSEANERIRCSSEEAREQARRAPPQAGLGIPRRSDGATARSRGRPARGG